MAIDPERLRELRKRKKMSRQDLADRSKISTRQLARLESNSISSGTPRERTINELARVLEVEPEVLTGDVELPEPVLNSRHRTGERMSVSALLLPEMRLAYALIKRRYGLNMTTLFNAAPLLFILLAEGSFLSRREKMEEVLDAADQLVGLGDGHLSFAYAALQVMNGTTDEEESIKKRDLFGNDICADAFDYGYNPSTNNPFADYLRELAKRINDPDIIDVEDGYLASDALDGFPYFKVCAGDLSQIAGGSGLAAYALEQGHAAINDIPEELWADDASDKRAKWLEEQLPENVRDMFENIVV